MSDPRFGHSSRIVRKVMQLANEEARRLNHEYIGTEHILVGLVKEGFGVATTALRNLNVDLDRIRIEIGKLVCSGPGPVPRGTLPMTPRARKVIGFAMDEARSLNHNHVGTEHILLGLLREDQGVAAQVLMNLGLALDTVRKEVRTLVFSLITAESVPTQPPAEPSYMSLPLADELRQLLRDAATFARWFGHKTVCTGYLLLGLVHASGSAAVRALTRSGVAPQIVRRELLEEYPEPGQLGSFAGPPHSLMIDAVVRAAAEDAQARSPFREIEQKIKAVQEEKENAVAALDFDKAADLRDQERELRKSLPERPGRSGWSTCSSRCCGSRTAKQCASSRPPGRLPRRCGRRSWRRCAARDRAKGTPDDFFP